MTDVATIVVSLTLTAIRHDYTATFRSCLHHFGPVGGRRLRRRRRPGQARHHPRRRVADEARRRAASQPGRPLGRVLGHRSGLRQQGTMVGPVDQVAERRHASAPPHLQQGRRRGGQLVAGQPAAPVRGQARGRRGRPDLPHRRGRRRRGAAPDHADAGRAHAQIQPGRQADPVRQRHLPRQRQRGRRQENRQGTQGPQVHGTRV
ncbi:conserved hypothetical protein [Ricinus communis]|uniref:Uncharacterized protein n=1 Tax=Ricinus communis TaxID=3988 RepID=B9TCQ2_RICCO|nr:conserved hypothetical protein [Ricinus communis]